MITFLLTVSVGLACTGEVDAKVVGWTTDGEKVLIRKEFTDGDETSLSLALFEASTDKVVKSWMIKDRDEGATERSANWTAAEAELVGMGVQIVGDAQPVSLAELAPDGVRLSTIDVRSDSSLVRSTRVLATRGDRSKLTEITVHACCFGGNSATTDGPWAIPGGKYAVWTESGCSNGLPIFLDLTKL